MAEYIEREKVYDMLNALGGCGAEPESWADGWDKAFDEAIRELDNIPAADVRPERHGRWIENLPGYVCSACQGQYYTGIAMVTLGYGYCPYCGAKMDGKGSE